MRKNHYHLIAACGVAGTLLLIAGCSRTRHPIVEVNGKILFADGKALPAGTQLIFHPSEGGSGGASASTGADGSFSVEHVSGTMGAEVGKYIVTLAAPPDDTSFHNMVPKAYCDGGVLVVDVKEGMSPVDLKVKRKEPDAKSAKR